MHIVDNREGGWSREGNFMVEIQTVEKFNYEGAANEPTWLQLLSHV